MRRLALSLGLLSLAACGSGASPPTTSPVTTTTASASPTVEFVTAKVSVEVTAQTLVQTVRFGLSDEEPCIASGEEWRVSFTATRSESGPSISDVEPSEYSDCIHGSGSTDFVTIRFDAEGFGEMRCRIRLDDMLVDEDTGGGECGGEATV